MKYNPMQSATAHNPFRSALKAGKNIQPPPKSAEAWCTYKSHSRNDTARPLTTTIAPTTGRGLISACCMPTIRSQKWPALIWFGQQFSQAVEARVPKRTAIGDPALGDTEAFRFDAAGADAPNLLGPHQPA